MDPAVIHDVYSVFREELEQYDLLQKKFKKACSQVILLNNQILEAQIRYDRARENGQKSHRYLGRLKLATLEGVRNMIYRYAQERADQLDAMQDRLVAVGLLQEEFV